MTSLSSSGWNRHPCGSRSCSTEMPIWRNQQLRDSGASPSAEDLPSAARHHPPERAGPDVLLRPIRSWPATTRDGCRKTLDSRNRGRNHQGGRALLPDSTQDVEGHPEWYRRALESHPSAVAEAAIKVSRSRIRTRRDCLHLWKLAREPSHRAVARLTVPSLLRAFPTRCTEPQVAALHEVLLAALRWQPDGIEEAIRARAARSGMDVSQQALWLAAGLFFSPEEYLPALVAFVEDGEEARVRQIVRFLAPDDLPSIADAVGDSGS